MSELDYDNLMKEIHMLLEGIKEGANRTSQIVKSLGHFSRVGEEQWVMSDVHEGIDSTLTLLSGEMGPGITIQKNYGDLPKIECFPGKLNQVFMNLLSNAIQAIEKNGLITIKTWTEATNAMISITDNGKGMTEEVRKKVFEPFFTTKEMGKGSGIGLSICYQIISQHHGHILVKSEPGTGTEFLLSIPLKQHSEKQVRKNP